MEAAAGRARTGRYDSTRLPSARLGPRDGSLRRGPRPRAHPCHPRSLARHAPRRHRHRPRRDARLVRRRPGSPAAVVLGPLFERLGAAPRGSEGRLGPRLEIELDLRGRLRPADRRGRAPGRLGGALRDPAALGREVDAHDPRRRPARTSPVAAAAGAARGRAARLPTAADLARQRRRTSPDGPTSLRRRRPARRVPGGRREPRGARRRDQRLNVFPVPDGDTGSNMMATVRAALDGGGGRRRRSRPSGWRPRSASGP